MVLTLKSKILFLTIATTCSKGRYITTLTDLRLYLKPETLHTIACYNTCNIILYSFGNNIFKRTYMPRYYYSPHRYSTFIKNLNARFSIKLRICIALVYMYMTVLYSATLFSKRFGRVSKYNAKLKYLKWNSCY